MKQSFSRALVTLQTLQYVCMHVCLAFLMLTVFQSRKLPVVLPHKLIPWMMENGLYPQDALDKDAVSAYWDHLGSQVDWASSHVKQCGKAFQPLWLWGDDATYNSVNDKLITVSIGAVLDMQKSSIRTVWPLFCYRFETWMQT